ncbi:RVT-1 multi-domain protein [Pyrenophora tritici-repentis]|nr:RVT-1 multi-domain protein [Pyrenophora tritici-repentis]
MEAADLTPIDFVPDTGAGISLIRRDQLRHYPRVKEEQLNNKERMRIDGVSSTAIFADNVIREFPFTVQAVDGEKIRMYGQVYVVNKLPVPCIIGNNILKPNGINIIRPLPQTPFGYLLVPNTIGEPSTDTFASAGNQFVDGDESHITFANLGATDVKIQRGQQLGYLEIADTPSREADIYFSLDHIFQGLPMPTEDEEPDDPPAGAPFIVEPPDDDTDMHRADVSMEWGPDYEKQVRHVVYKHSKLFRKELGRFNDGIKMPIPFYDDYDLSKLKQAPYSQSLRDQKAIDEVLNPLQDQGRITRVPLGQPSPVSAPAFVVWKNDKPRVVVDMRKVNKALIPDAYPLPKQDTILSAMGGAMVFSSLDFVKSFFQQEIAEEDQWKTAFVTAHRGHEMFTVSTMGLANSPGFFQHRMERLFESYLWDFILVYIDDIIIFSRTLEDHLTHLDRALTLLENAGVTLSIAKCHFAYPSIQALGTGYDLPKTLLQLEYAIGFFGYYRQFVPHYAHIANPLIQLKTRGFKGDTCKKGYGRKKYAMTKTTAEFMDDKQRAECEAAFEELKSALCNAPTRAHPDFSRPFIFYVDGSRERGFGCAVHQLDITDPNKPIERPILYLSKTLSPSESRYWPTELETAALVWALRKLPQYTDHEKFTVYTDHTALVNAFKDEGSVKGKRSERLQQWRLFLARFHGKIEVKHIPGKEHLNADGLSRLQTETDAPEVPNASPAVLLTRTGNRPLTTPTSSRAARRDVIRRNRSFAFPLDATYKADLVQISDAFRDRIVQALPTDPTLKKVYNEIRERVERDKADGEFPDTTRETFRLDTDTGLLYQTAPDGQERLCIPAALHQEVMQPAHDRLGHPGRTRTCERIRASLYVPHLRKLAATYIAACPVCNVARPSTLKPAGKLQPIDTPFIPFYAVAMDFIVGLPVTPDGFDTILTVTDKATKAVKLIPGKTDGDALYWAIRFWDYVVCDWGLPKAIISDRDGRFLSAFWQALFKKVGTTLAMTTAYHPQADGQSERTNQIVEILLRCMIANHDAPMVSWDELLPDVQFAVNTSRNFTTGETPFKILYGVHPRDGTNVHQTDTGHESAEQFYRD